MSDTLTPEQMRKHLGGASSPDTLTPDQMRQRLAAPASRPAQPMFREGQPAPGASAEWGTGIKAVGQETQVPSPVQYESPDAYRERVTRDNLPAAVAMETAAQIGGTIAHGVADPIMQADQEGTASGWAKGVVRSGIGAVTSPFSPATTADRLKQEATARGESVSPLASAMTFAGNVATLKPIFEKYAEMTPDFDKMAAESKRLGMPLAEFLANVAAVGKDVLPFAVGAAVNKAAPLPGAIKTAMDRRAAFERSAPTRVAIDPASVEYTGGRAPRAPVAPERLPLQGEPQGLPAPETPQAPPPRPVADLRASRPPMPRPQEPWMPPRPMPLAGPVTAPRAPVVQEPSSIPDELPTSQPKLSTEPTQVDKPTQPDAQAPALEKSEVFTAQKPAAVKTAEPTPKEVMPSANDVRPSPGIDDVRPAATKAASPAEVTSPSTEPPLVAKMRAEPDLEARTRIWQDAARTNRESIWEAEAWARKAQKARGEKDGLIVGRDAIELELNPPKVKKAKKADLGAKRKGREGPTVGVGLGAVGTKGRNWIEAVEGGVNAVTGRAIGAAQEMFPKADAAVGKLHEWALKSPEDAISPEVGATLRAGRSLERRLQMRADAAIRDLLAVEKSVTPEMRDQIARSLNSEDSDINPLPEPQRRVVERARTVLQEIRRLEADRGIRSEETQTEYPKGRLSRIRRERSIIERVFSPRRGGIKTEGYEVAEDMYGAFVRMSESETGALVPRGAPLRYLKFDSGKRTTLVKFTDSPEGKAAYEKFLSNVEEKFTGAKSRLAKDVKREARSPRYGQSDEMMDAYADVPDPKDVIVRKFDPIPADVAKEMFVQSPSTRMKATTDKSARNIARATAQENLSKLVDHKGPVTKPVPAGTTPEQIAANAPENYEFMPGENLGALSGKYVRSDVAEMVKGSFGKEAMSNGEGFSRAAMETFKVARLLPSPRTWFRQFPSNLEFENAMGMSNWNPEWIGHKIRGLRALRPGSKYYDDLVAEGFLDPATITLEELGVAERDFLKEGNAGYRWTKAVLTGGLSEAFPRQHRAAVEWLGRRYGFADGWTKATGYVYARESLGMDHQHASEFVRKWTPSPDAVSDIVRWWSTHLVGDPWARFRAETARINLLLAKEKPVRFAMNWNQKHIIRAALIAAGASALSDDEEDALENEQGEGAIAVGKDDKGRPLGIDYTYFSILGDRFDTPSRVGKSGFEHAFERGLQITGLGDNPIYRAGARQITRHDEYGRQINPEGTLRGGVSALARDLVAGWVPDLATRHQQKLRAAWQDKPYSPNQPVQTKTQAVLDVFFGLKLTPLDAEQALNKIQRQGASALGDIWSVPQKARLQDPDADIQPDIDRALKLADLLWKEFNERSAPLKRMADLKAKKSK